jgi:hypothetical protein
MIVRKEGRKWMGHVACMTRIRNTYRILAENLKERDHLGDISIDRRIILKWNLNRV